LLHSRSLIHCLANIVRLNRASPRAPRTKLVTARSVIIEEMAVPFFSTCQKSPTCPTAHTPNRTRKKQQSSTGFHGMARDGCPRYLCYQNASHCLLIFRAGIRTVDIEALIAVRSHPPRSGALNAVLEVVSCAYQWTPGNQSAAPLWYLCVREL